MTRQEVNQLMALVKVNWPSAFRGLGENEKKILFASWFVALRDISAQTATLALLKLVSSCKFPPTVAEIREKVCKIRDEAEEIVLLEESWNDLFPGDNQNFPKLNAARSILRETRHFSKDSGEMSLDQFLSVPEMLNLSSGDLEKSMYFLTEGGLSDAEAD